MDFEEIKRRWSEPGHDKAKFRLGVGFVAGIFLLWGVWTSFYAVPAESVGVVLRFGAVNDDYDEPGLHFKLPYGVDEVFIVPDKRQLKQEFGFGTPGATNDYQFSNEQEDEKSMVTGDLNMALVEWVIQYRIREPKQYLFNTRNPDATLRDASESVMREIVGDKTVDEVITIGRQDIEAEFLQKLEPLIQKYRIGLSIDQVQLKNVNPPRAVQASFNEVNQAQQERERSINVANGEYNKSVPQARGVADQKISEATGYATERVNEAEGDRNRFNALLAEYTKAPDVTRQRLYLETMGKVIPKLERVVIMDEDAQQVLPLLQLPGTAGGSRK